jgi:hypothetical protein
LNVVTQVPPSLRQNLFMVMANLALADLYDAAKTKSVLQPDRWGMTWKPRSGLYVDFLARSGVKSWGGVDVVGRLTGRLIEALNPDSKRDRWIDFRTGGFDIVVLVPYAEAFHRGLTNDDMGWTITPWARPLWPTPIPDTDVRRWHDEAWNRVRGSRPTPVRQDPGPTRASYAAARLRRTPSDAFGQRVLQKLYPIANFHDRVAARRMIEGMGKRSRQMIIAAIHAALDQRELDWLMDYLK